MIAIFEVRVMVFLVGKNPKLPIAVSLEDFFRHTR